MLANCIYIRTFTIAMSKVSKSFFLFFLFTALLVSFSCNKDDLKWDLPRTNSLDSVQTSVGPTPSSAVVAGTYSCASLSNVNSLYYGMNGTNALWGISSSGYAGSCWVAPNPNNSGQLGTAVGNASTPHYTQFTRTFYSSGYMEMWINTPNGNGYNNVIPAIYVDGVALSSTTIEGQSSAFYWLKLRTSGITAGTHTIKIQFVGSYYTFKVDEITFFENQ